MNASPETLLNLLAVLAQNKAEATDPRLRLQQDRAAFLEMDAMVREILRKLENVNGR